VTRDRAVIVQQLVDGAESPAGLLAELKAYPWDSKVALAVLSRRGAVAILDRFLEQMVSVDDVHAWADAIESRDDVGFEPGFEEVLKDLLSDLASPELSEPLSHKKALDWIRRLSGS